MKNTKSLLRTGIVLAIALFASVQMFAEHTKKSQKPVSYASVNKKVAQKPLPARQPSLEPVLAVPAGDQKPKLSEQEYLELRLRWIEEALIFMGMGDWLVKAFENSKHVDPRIATRSTTLKETNVWWKDRGSYIMPGEWKKQGILVPVPVYP